MEIRDTSACRTTAKAVSAIALICAFNPHLVWSCLHYASILQTKLNSDSLPNLYIYLYMYVDSSTCNWIAYGRGLDNMACMWLARALTRMLRSPCTSNKSNLISADVRVLKWFDANSMNPNRSQSELNARCSADTA